MNLLWTKKELIAATNGSDPSSNFLINQKNVFGISIDDRTIKEGDLYVAIKGDKYDGHDFINSAISKGASGVIVSDKKIALRYSGLFVKDTKIALINIAQFSRNRFTGKVIAITGASGYIGSALSEELKKYSNKVIRVSRKKLVDNNQYKKCIEIIFACPYIP